MKMQPLLRNDDAANAAASGQSDAAMVKFRNGDVGPSLFFAMRERLIAILFGLKRVATAGSGFRHMR